MIKYLEWFFIFVTIAALIGFVVGLTVGGLEDVDSISLRNEYYKGFENGYNTGLNTCTERLDLGTIKVYYENEN